MLDLCSIRVKARQGFTAGCPLPPPHTFPAPSGWISLGCPTPWSSGCPPLPHTHSLCLQDPRTAAKAEVEATMKSRQLMREELMIARYEVWGSVEVWGGVPAADAGAADHCEI